MNPHCAIGKVKAIKKTVRGPQTRLELKRRIEKTIALMKWRDANEVKHG